MFNAEFMEIYIEKFVFDFACDLFRTSSVVLPKPKCREFAAINRTLKELSPKDIENGTWGIIPYEKKTFQ